MGRRSAQFVKVISFPAHLHNQEQRTKNKKLVPTDQDIKIKDYQIHLPPLGEGSYGRVFRATYRGISERALKIFRPGAVDRSAMARELEKLSSVAEHQGIVTLHDFDLLSEQPYYAMGLHADQDAEGIWKTRTLEQLCGKVDPRTAWRLVREIADALAYLHRHQIIHCDIKPSNILLTDESPPRVKICDFGQSRGSAAENFRAAGTPLYASPEQLRQPRDSADGKGFRWDVYSFGVVAFKLITGELPRLQPLADAEEKSLDPDATLPDATLEATLADSSTAVDGDQLATMTEAVEDIEWPDGVPLSYERRELIEQCLSLDPLQRPADLREVHGRIQQIDQHQATRRSRMLNGIFATLLVVAIWASGFALVQARKAKTAGADAEELALIVVNELSRPDFSGRGMEKMLGLIADHSETFLKNLPPDHAGTRRTLRLTANTAAFRGRQALSQGKLDEALAKYQSAYGIRSQLAAEPNAPQDIPVFAARDLMEIGKIHELRQDYSEALSSYREALELRSTLYESSPNAIEPSRIRELSSTYQALARVSMRLGDPKAAVTYLAEVIARFRSALEAASGNPEADTAALSRPMLHLLQTLGETLYQSGDLAESDQAYAELIELAEGLESASPTIREEAREHAMDALHAMARIQLDLDLPEKALELYRQEIVQRRAAFEARPFNPQLRLALADALAMAATCVDIAHDTDRWTAINYLEESQDLYAKLPPDLRNLESTQLKIDTYRDLLSDLLEHDE